MKNFKTFFSGVFIFGLSLSTSAGLSSQENPVDLKVGGLVQLWTLAAPDYDKYVPASLGASSSFLAKRAEVALQGSIAEILNFVIMMDFARYPGTFTVTGDRASLPTQDLFIDYLIPFAHIRVGQFLKPITMESDQPSGDLYFIRRSMHTGGGTFAGNIAGTVAFGDQRDIGIMAHYQFTANSTPFLEYKLGFFQGDSQNLVEFDNNKALAGKINIMPFGEVLKLGVSGQLETATTAAQRKDRAGAHMLLSLGGLVLSFEYMHGWDYAVENTGLYGAIVYDLKEATGIALQPGFKVDYFFKGGITQNDPVAIYTGGLNYQVVPKHARIQLNYIYVQDTTIDHQVALNTQVNF